ncbi:MAG: NAD(P)-dependent oxidoreductase [Verrucomicrobia bacterium]|nr:NAD(P)-dependent oxidoreductase [Verrucomicrobiota bacterium]
MPTPNPTVAFVGVGRMGANMARRLHEKAFHVTAVFDAHRPLAEALAAELGCAAPDKLRAVSESADTILTVVTDDAAMRRIYSIGGSPDGDALLTAEGDVQNKLFINCATVSPRIHLEVEAAVVGRGGFVLEACMASSIPQARDGTLYLMCAGEERAFQRAEPVLRALGSTVRYLGRSGNAAKVKALVNMVMNINTAGLAEGLGLGAALGLDLTMLREVFAETGAGSRVLQTDGEDMQNRAHDCYFSAAHAAKDSGIALALAERAGLNLPLAAATKAQYDRMVAAGFGELDKSGIAELTFPGRGRSAGG